MWIALVTTAALGQDVPQLNGQLYRPPSDSEATLWTEDTHRAPDGYTTARTFVQYVRAPVRWTGADGERDLLVSDLLELDLLGATHYRGLRLGAHLPVFGVAAGGLTPDQPGLGDLALDLKGTLVDGGDAPLGVALMGRVTLPTASVAAPVGAAATGWEVMGIVDHRWDRFMVAANVGTRGVPLATYEDLVWNDQVFARLGSGIALTPDTGLSADLAAQTNWASGRNPAGTAVELMGGAWARVAPDWVMRGGLSAGLTRSPGAPAARAIVGFAWEPDPYPDTDMDGIVDRDDWCPGDPEDVDGFEDWDGCHDPQVTVKLQLTDEGGQPLEHGHATLAGTEQHTVALRDPYVTLHPGTYTLTASAEGYDDLQRQITLGSEQGARIDGTLLARTATLTVFAVDTTGRPVDAAVSVAGGTPLPLDGSPLELPVGEHALVVTSGGHRAHAATVALQRGDARQLSVVLDPLPGDADDPLDDDQARLDP